MIENDLVYHYCTVETFQKMMEQRKLRLSDVEKSNDYAERRWLPEMIGRHFDGQARARKSPEFPGLRIVDVMERLMQREKLYAACFSEKADLLSQWRAYAMDGRGVAVGVDRRGLECAARQGGSLRFLKICYDRERQEQYAQRAAEYMLENVRMGAELPHAAASVCGEETVKFGIMKNPAFEEEQEWRLCVTSVPECADGNAVKADRSRISEIQIYYSNHRLISYRDFSFPDHTESWIRRIVLGPKCRLSEEDVEMCLAVWGYDSGCIEICRSQATYR